MTSHNINYNKELFAFLDNSPTAFHATQNIREELKRSGMIELVENEPWKIHQGRGYFVVREDSAIAAFTIGSEDSIDSGFRMIGSHCDSPGLQLKPHAGVSSPPYLQLGVEIYGSPLLNPWFDRDLSLAGRVCCEDSSADLRDFLIDFSRPLLTIPSLAIHLDREANSSRTIDKQKFLPPLLTQTVNDQLPDFLSILKDQLLTQHPDSDVGKILGFDLYCYDTQKASHLGLNQDFITSSRLDNLLSCHVATKAFSRAGTTRNTLFLCTNHEENGSTSTTGAQGTFVDRVFERLIPQAEKRHIALRNSFFVSIDNAHAVHPNFRDKADPDHDVVLNGGPVIKTNANQRYATNSRSASLFKLICNEATVPYQEFVMRTDMPCGSTIGPMTAARLGVETIDVGAPTLAMHSIRELAGSDDPFLLDQAISSFLKASTIHRRS